MSEEESFGQVVYKRRLALDLTQEELAKRVGCAVATIRKIEIDNLCPSIQIAERLAMALSILLDDRAMFVRRARIVDAEFAEFSMPIPTLEEIGGEDLTGRAIRGYALAERIGAGGMGAVYRATQLNVGREVAIKIILPSYANHPDFIRRFEAEAQLVARLEHPHIVPLYDYWREPSAAYQAMRLLRGGSVQNMLQNGHLPLKVILRLLEQISLALSAVHRIGVIHRDLKPANVLLDEEANVYLADFGIAKNLGNPNLTEQTQAGVIIGSPNYMSPEQIKENPTQPQTDIYSLGVMLYEMLTGALPFSGPSPLDVMVQHISTPLPPLSAHRPGLPTALDVVLGRATAKDAQDRYPDVLSLLNDFRQAIAVESAVLKDDSGELLSLYYPTRMPPSPTGEAITGASVQRKRIFLSYKRGVQPDEILALALYDALSREHDVFIDKAMLVGAEWRKHIQHELENCDFLILLLSSSTAQSEMVEYEVSMAHRLGRARKGRPCILPVRVAFSAPFEYPLSAYLNPLNWAFWRDETDNQTLIAELQAAIAGGQLSLDNLREKEAMLQAANLVDNMPRPVPSANIGELERPDGTMNAESRFYIERPGDVSCQREMTRGGATIVIKAPRQMGKSSLLVRAATQARRLGREVAFLDFQLLDENMLVDSQRFFQGFCHWIADELDLDAPVEEAWQGGLGHVQSCTRYLRRNALKALDKPITLVMDEVDRMLGCSFRSDFFGMLRSWHNNRATNPEWRKLDILLVISTEPYLLIDDLKQSPFNVGEVIRLDDFSLAQTAQLNDGHGGPFDPPRVERLYNLLGGHPYLTRQALYRVAVAEIGVERLLVEAADENGPFGDHLHRHLIRFSEHPELSAAMLQIIQDQACSDDILYNRLHGAGLVRRKGDFVVPRCKLYAQYFQERLGHG